MAISSISTAAVFLLAAFSALFEPIRNSLWPLGDAVGGVGGVGGLTNLHGPLPSCNHTAAYTGLYCFHPGVLGGLSAFAVVTTIIWVAPLLIVALGFILLRKGEPAEWNEKGENNPPLLSDSDAVTDTAQAAAAAALTYEKSKELSEVRLNNFKFVFALLSALWFISPLCAFLASDFYRTDAAHAVLGIALAAAFPLSWSLSLVALPMTNLTGPLLGLTKGHVRRAHMYMATWTGVGAAFHGLGELVYLASSRILWSSLDLRYDGENLLYAAGLTTLSLGLLHFTIAVFRCNFYTWFRRLHVPVAMFYSKMYLINHSKCLLVLVNIYRFVINVICIGMSI